MWDIIGDILIALGQAPSGAGRPPSQPAGAKPSRFALPIAIFCWVGVAGSVCAIFFQDGDLWQIAKLLLLAIVLGGCGAAAFAAFRESRKQRRALSNHCTRCGYDLTDSTSGRCPECGLDRA